MKDLINKIIQNLGEAKLIKTILLKAQIIAAKLNNREFEEWIHNEQNGYPTAENIPKYRKLNAMGGFLRIERQRGGNLIMNTYNINATIANIGNGTVSTGYIYQDNPIFHILDTELQEKIRSLVSQLICESKKVENEDLQMIVDLISEECKKDPFGKNTLKIALNAVQSLAIGISANQLTPIVTQLLALIK